VLPHGAALLTNDLALAAQGVAAGTRCGSSSTRPVTQLPLRRRPPTRTRLAAAMQRRQPKSVPVTSSRCASRPVALDVGCGIVS